MFLVLFDFNLRLFANNSSFDPHTIEVGRRLFCFNGISDKNGIGH